MNSIENFCLIFLVILCTLHNEKVYGRPKHQLRKQVSRRISIARRQGEGNTTARVAGKKRDLFMKDGRTESYFEPYWESGEWVFLRGTDDKQKTKSSGVPGRKTLKPVLNHDPELYRDCDLICLGIYKKYYGAICAQRFDTTLNWVYEYRAFANLCEMEQENCKSPKNKWFPISRSSYCNMSIPALPLHVKHRPLLLEHAVKTAGAVQHPTTWYYQLGPW
ncbi:hypothetical protein K1T71_000881 [Dendrolimus kikuchii]|uniref:Uncharacterized protein n=1 Tax=Dendrolimus kikuchii TaxID=765133 RepID=A0ACC1DGG6_9NEOP|nr:hypothetical protein K1T71_000881 [Dendrolimus kikuchii]